MRRDFGKLIKKARLKRELTLEQVADLCAMSSGYVSQLERGIGVPRTSLMVEKLASALGLNPSYLDYLCGRFPYPERILFLNHEQFTTGMDAFRRASAEVMPSKSIDGEKDSHNDATSRDEDK